jgi:alkylated DNA nucleotide flippase Atl1
VEPSLPSAYAERVLDLVERIPAGQVLAYGDIAELLAQGGPRQVGRVMALWGAAVPWWRVVRASGHPALGHEREALDRLRAEHAPLVGGGSRVDMPRGRWAAPAAAQASADTRAGAAGAAGLSAGSAEIDR